MKRRLSAAIATTVMASAMASPVQADLEASVAVATSYLWRGQDLGKDSGSPAVSGDLKYSHSGFHTGVWVSSGDSSAGTEYDLWAGYGGELDKLRYDLSIWTYVYPAGGKSDDNLGDLSEVVLTLGYDAFSLSYYDNIAGAAGYSYLTLSAKYQAFTGMLGMTSNENSDDDYAHLDLSYAYNENLTFKISKVVDQDKAEKIDTDTNIVLSYSLPLK